MSVRNKCALAAAVLLAWGVMGCYSKVIDLNPGPAQAIEADSAIPINLGVEKGPVVLNRDARLEFKTTPPPTTVAEFLAEKLEQNRVVNLAVHPNNTEAGKVNAVLYVSENLDMDAKWLPNMVKAMVVGATYFLLAPALPIEMDLAVSAVLDLRTPEGETIKQYKSSANYRLSYTTLWPGIDRINELHLAPYQRVTDDLIRQLQADRELLESLTQAPVN